MEATAAWVELRDPITGHYRSGTGLIVRGSDVPRDSIEALVMQLLGDGWERLIVEAQHLAYHRRIKRCERLDCFGCDLEGEWHSHWSPVRHSVAAPECCHAVALPVWPDVLKRGGVA